MRVSVPSKVAHGEYVAFPEGAYDGEISEVKFTQNQDGSWRALKVSLSDVRAKEGTPDPGRSRYTDTITVETDGINVLEVVDFTDDSLPYPIQKAGNLLATLAEALNVADEAALQRGEIDFDPEALVEALSEGTFEGERVSFEVSNWGDNDDNDQVDHYGPA